MYTKQELIKMWSNDQKRAAFIKDFKAWGVWFTQPELNLTYYKYDLPDGSRLIAMEYLRKAYLGEKVVGGDTAVTCHNHYLQSDAYFNPSSAPVYTMTNRLKDLKEKLAKELKENAQSGSEQKA